MVDKIHFGDHQYAKPAVQRPLSPAVPAVPAVPAPVGPVVDALEWRPRIASQVLSYAEEASRKLEGSGGHGCRVGRFAHKQGAHHTEDR
jgi:hypothetical protein